jgi:hypothetical protein
VKITVPIERLRERKLMVATPMYGGMCTAAYCVSMCDLMAMAAKNGLSLAPVFLANHSLITHARNRCADIFLKSGADHLLFIDADIGFRPEAALALLALQSDDSPYDVLAAPYPLKHINWERVRKAVQLGHADASADALGKLTSDFVFTPLQSGVVNLQEPVEVRESGTGFMIIRRRTFERFADAHPDWRCEFNDEVMMQFFHTEIDREVGQYVSEDYWFCRRIRELGMRIWLCPWIELKHVGQYVYEGSLAAYAVPQDKATE